MSAIAISADTQNTFGKSPNRPPRLIDREFGESRITRMCTKNPLKWSHRKCRDSVYTNMRGYMHRAVACLVRIGTSVWHPISSISLSGSITTSNCRQKSDLLCLTLSVTLATFPLVLSFAGPIWFCVRLDVFAVRLDTNQTDGGHERLKKAFRFSVF